MLEALKLKISTKISQWMDQIDKSPDGSIQVDIRLELETILAENLVHITFGEDINDEAFDFKMR